MRDTQEPALTVLRLLLLAKGGAHAEGAVSSTARFCERTPSVR
jgi:hypothetical protein